MSYNFPVLTIALLATTAIPAYRIVRDTGTDGQGALATASTQSFAGVAGIIAGEANKTIDVHKCGIVPIEYGGNIAVGDPLTSDATGRAVKAVEGDNVIGKAQEVGAAGTIGSLLIALRDKLTNSGVAALIAAGLGAGVAVDHADASPVTVLAADATKDRAVLVVATCTQTLAGDDAPTFDIGWDADPDGIIDQLVLAGATAGDVFIGAGNVPATNKIIATLADGGTATNDAGAFNVVVLALPTS